MEYQYLYQTKDNENRSGRIRARSREDAYARLRRLGIRPYRLIGENPPAWKWPALWGACGIDCEFCSGCDNRGGGRTESIYQLYIDGEKEIREINESYSAPFVRG